MQRFGRDPQANRQQKEDYQQHLERSEQTAQHKIDNAKGFKLVHKTCSERANKFCAEKYDKKQGDEA